MKPDLVPKHFILPILCWYCCIQAICFYDYRLTLPELPKLNNKCYMGERCVCKSANQNIECLEIQIYLIIFKFK